ncbi:MAG: hypothetical protein H0X13_07200 [Ramlibacter sp.]|nr:hypothetical protein [Ramlibacter sp.]
MQADTFQPPRVNWTFVAVMGVLCACVFGFNYSRYGFHADSYLWTIRTVVKLAFAFFALSYISSPLHDWRPTRFSTLLMKHRATTGAAFAVVQLSAAACALVIWNNWPQIIHAISTPVERVLGVMVFTWIFIMLITSNQFAIDKLGRRLWSGIHTYGMMVIWIAFLLDYLRRTVEWSLAYGVFTGTLLLILFLRARVLLVRRRAASPAPAGL